MHDSAAAVLVAEPGPKPISDESLSRRRTALLEEIETFADRLAHRPDEGGIAAPIEDLEQLRKLGLLTAFLDVEEGGLALGDPSGQATLLRLLAAIGGADLVLGRLLEGHVNALLLTRTFGSREQWIRAAENARQGRLFGVWNTGAPEVLRLEPQDHGAYQLRGVKTFASGAKFVARPIVTAALPEGGWQMTMPRMDEASVAHELKFNESFWTPMGMEGSESFEVDFTGVPLQAEDLIGLPGDFYRDPLFRGGAIRFAAVHAGAVIRLHSSFAEWLRDRGRGEDPYQLTRLGELSLLAREAALWVERAGVESAQNLSDDVPKHAAEQVVEFANAMRVAVERIATTSLRHVTMGVGAHGLLRPQRFGRTIRDLTMYLRQPAPDQTLAEVGRAALRNLNIRSDGAAHGLWSGKEKAASIPASYFDEVYAKSTDPWGFETSPYEAEKYEATLRTLSEQRYHHALEVGCSIGVLTRKLAARCDSLLSVDVSEAALATAQNRCADLPQVRLERRPIPSEMPAGSFDLIVVSEVAYYWDKAQVQQAADAFAAQQKAGAQLLLVHFTELVPDYPLTGDQAHAYFLSRPEWRSVTGSRQPRYRMDLLERL